MFNMVNKEPGKFLERVLVTGASGFIGSHVVENLVTAGFRVTALAHYNSRSSLGWLSHLSEDIIQRVKIVFGDITDTEQMEKYIKDHEIIVNIAALIAIPYSYIAPRSYLNTNLMGTLNICEAVRKNNLRLIHFSTSEVYGTPHSVPITEDHPINPQSPYAASKSAADQLCISYFKSFDLKVNIIRPFNTYGPRQSMRAIIPTILAQFIFNSGKINLGNLSPRRDFTFVTDTADAVRSLVLGDIGYGRVIQLGTGKAYSVEDIVKVCEEISGIEAQIQIQDFRLRPEKSEIEILLSNPSVANDLLNWKANIGFKDGLRKTYDWLKSNEQLYGQSESYFT